MNSNSKSSCRYFNREGGGALEICNKPNDPRD